MGTEVAQHSEVLKPHLASDEDLHSSDASQGQIIAVTDRRVLTLNEQTSHSKQQQEVESVLLTSDRVVGTHYEKTERGHQLGPSHLLSFVLGLIGLASIFLGALADEGQGILILFGLLAVAGGILLYFTDEDRSEGSVSITVRRAGETSDRTWSFPEGHTEVPRAVSEQVARIHHPE